jgi:hypothetical protein
MRCRQCGFDPCACGSEDYPPSGTNQSYLQDPEHPWSLDPNCTGKSLLELANEMQDRGWDGWQIILEGYIGLKERNPEAKDEDCLNTSIMWYFG